MIKLNSDRALEAVLAGAVATTQPAAAVGYNDKDAAGFDGDSQLEDLNSTTAVEICPAPATGAIRHIDYLTIRNYDSAAVVVTVRINEGGTIHNIIEATLDAGEMLGFTHSNGWYVNTADGSRKSGAVQDLSSYATTVAVAAGYQPLDSDLTAIAALTTTSYGRAFLALADAAAARTALSLGTAATAATGDFDAAGSAAAAQAASQPLDSDLTAIAALSTTVFGRALLALADAAALRTAAGLGTLATQSGTFSGTSSGTNTGDQTISDATISLTDITTNNSSTSAHGFLKKLSNAAGEFMNGVGNWVAAAALATANTFTAAQRGAISALTDASTVAINLALANQYSLVLGGSRTLGVPTNIVAGQQGTISVRQDATGSRTLAYAWPYVWAGGTAGVLSTPGCTRDLLGYSVDAYNSAAVTITIASPGVVSMTAHGFDTGQRVQLTTTGALPTGLTASTTYFVSKVDADSFKLCTSLVNAAAGTFINTSGSQSGVHTLVGCTISLNLSKAFA